MDPDERRVTGYGAHEPEEPAKVAVDECAGIEDPIRKGLCRICQAPIVGEAPFCKDHEPPVP